jgi:adenine-specific DNA-methyltransferase
LSNEKPFLNWTGKAERHEVMVPTLPRFVHKRHSTLAILETLQLHTCRRRGGAGHDR